jgi:methionine aminopeptidase
VSFFSCLFLWSAHINISFFCKVFHSNPTILHYKNKQNNGVMAPGHVFTIEPMINEGDCGNVMWRDDWTATTKDGKRSAQFEHTVKPKKEMCVCVCECSSVRVCVLSVSVCVS